MPREAKAPKLWPAVPAHVTTMLSSGRPALPWRRAISPLSIAPSVRSEVLHAGLDDDGRPAVDRRARLLDQLEVEHPIELVVLQLHAVRRDSRAPPSGRYSTSEQSIFLAFGVEPGAPLHDAVGAPDHLGQRAEAQRAP